MTVSAMCIEGCRPPQVPTRISRVAPSWMSSSKTIAALGQPMPVVCTDSGRPSNVPVKPSIPRSSLTQRAPGSKNVSAMYGRPAGDRPDRGRRGRSRRARRAGGSAWDRDEYGPATGDLELRYFRKRLVVLSASTLPPVWQVGQ